MIKYGPRAVENRMNARQPTCSRNRMNARQPKITKLTAAQNDIVTFTEIKSIALLYYNHCNLQI